MADFQVGQDVAVNSQWGTGIAVITDYVFPTYTVEFYGSGKELQVYADELSEPYATGYK